MNILDFNQSLKFPMKMLNWIKYLRSVDVYSNWKIRNGVSLILYKNLLFPLTWAVKNVQS